MVRSNEVTVTTQADLDKAIKRGVSCIYIDSPGDAILHLSTSGDGLIVALNGSHVVARGNSRVEARDNSRVHAWDSSRVVARGNSLVEVWDSSRVEARDNSRVEARDNSRVEARDNSVVTARNNSQVRARDNTHVVAVGYSRIVASGNSEVKARGETHVVAWSNSRIEAWDDSRVVAMDSSHVMAWDKVCVEACINATVEARGCGTVVAWGNSRIVAGGNSHIVAWGNSHIVASPFVAVHVHETTVTVEGGVVIDAIQYNNDGQSWCEFHGVTVTDGKAVLYKAVYDDWRTKRGPEWTYAPGSIVKAKDFDPIRECGQGLHLCPSPRGSRRYLQNATRYVAVEVDVDTIVPLDDKAKVPQCRVLHEVNHDGERVFR